MNLTGKTQKHGNTRNTETLNKLTITTLSFFRFKPDSGRMVHKIYIFMNSFILQNPKTELKSLSHSSLTFTLSKVTVFAKKF